MFIKVRYQSKCRRINEAINSVAELKKKIEAFFGKDALGFHIVYKDCDDEMVNIIDDEDLVNCLEEAKELKLKGIVVFLRAQQARSRSVSAKKQKVDEVDLIVANEGSEESETEIELEKSQVIEENLREEHALRAECERKIEQVKSKKEERLARIAKKEQERKERRERRQAEKNKDKAGKSKDKAGKSKDKKDKNPAQNLMFKMKAMKDKCAKEGIEHPFKPFMQLLKSIKKECPALEMNPKLIMKVLTEGKADITATVKTHYDNAIKENPDHVKDAEKLKGEWKDFKKKTQQKIDKIKANFTRKQRKDEVIEEPLPEEDDSFTEIEEVPAEATVFGITPKTDIVEETKEVKEPQAKLTPEEKEELKKKREAEKLEKQKARQAAKEEKEKAKARNALIVSKVKAIKPIFPKIPRPEVRDCVIENLDKENDQIVAILMERQKK